MTGTPYQILFILAFCFSLIGNVAMGAGGNVVSPKKRGEILELGNRLTNLKDEALFSRFEELEYPFAFEEPELEPEPEVQSAPAKIVTQKAEPKVEPVKEVIISDEEILTQVASKMNPTGTMTMGGKTILIFPTGNIAEGKTIRANAQGKPRRILLEEVTPDYYKLRLNDVVIVKEFDEPSAAGKISKYSESEESENKEKSGNE